MNKIDREQLQSILETARIKPRIKRELRFVPEEINDWDDRDFLAVMNRSRTEGVMVAPLDEQYCIPFRLHRRMPNASGRTEAVICDICMTWQRGSHSAVISFQRNKSSVSFLCCADLLCSLHVRDKTPQAALSRAQVRESITKYDRIERLKTRLAKIVKSAI